MTRRWMLLLVVAAVLFAPTVSARPVFDCKDPEVRREYPAQCPELGPPGILGGEPGGRPSAGHSCTGLCGVVKGVLDHIPGLGGIL